MKRTLYFILIICIAGCSNINGSDSCVNRIIKERVKVEEFSMVSNSKFYCGILYLDAYLYRKPYCYECDFFKPMFMIIETDTIEYVSNIHLSEAILYLDSITGNETQFEFSFGTAGASITNYSDSLYEIERAAWIENFSNRRILNTH